MKKSELIEELKSMGLEVKDTDSYNDLLKVYKEEKALDELFEIQEEKIAEFFDNKEETEPMLHVPRQEDIEERQYFLDDDRRNKLMRSIIEFIPNLGRGIDDMQPHDRLKLMDLYNAFYSRNDSATCRLCLDRAYDALRKLYNQHK